MHDTSYKSALARRACRYSDARPPRKTDGVLLESELPPHMRGKGRRRVRQAGRAGITPAYAGKSTTCSSRATGRWDHPRICGEKHDLQLKGDWQVGSPPHVRGKELHLFQRVSGKGITPAYAGKRRRPAFLLGGTQDHPRICGEKMNASVKAIELRGSPPHMRGKDERQRQGH